MKYLVTGATGFIGSNLCNYLTGFGHTVYYQGRNKKKLKSFNLEGVEVHASLEIENPNRFIDNLPSDLDVVIHTAGVVHSFDNNTFFKDNTFITKRLVKDLKSKYKSLTFCLISSLAAAGPSSSSRAKQESDLELPVSDYGRSKLTAEKALLNNAPKEWNKIIIRPPMVIGPGDTAMLEVFKMVQSSFVPVAGLNGFTNRYSFINVFDLIEGIYKSTLLKNSDLFYISHPETITYNKLITEIKLTLKKDKIFKISIPLLILKFLAKIFKIINTFFPKFSPRMTPDKIFEIRESAWTCSGEKSIRLLGVKYQRNLTDTISETSKDYLERNWL